MKQLVLFVFTLTDYLREHEDILYILTDNSMTGQFRYLVSNAVCIHEHY